MKYVVTIQSAGRPQFVKKTEQSLYPIIPRWYVPTQQINDYTDAGATNITGIGGRLPMKAKQLNSAIKYNDGYIVTMDDDFQDCLVIDENKNDKKIHLKELLDESVKELYKSDMMVAGFPNTTNPFYTKFQSQNYGMIFGGFMIHKQHQLKFDESLNELEDLDFVIQNHLTYGGILRINRFLVNFHMYGRSKKLDAKYKGGYDKLRTEETQKNTVKILRAKYPSLIFEDVKLGDSLHKKIKWKKLKPTATLF